MFYADEGHLCFLFVALAELEHGLQCLDVLHSMGMTVNLQKSAVLFTGERFQRQRMNQKLL